MKFIKNKLLNAPVIILITSLILQKTLSVLNGYGIYFIRQHGIDLILPFIIGVSAILSLKYIFKYKFIRITSIVLIIFMLIVPLLNIIINWNIDYTTFSSPNNRAKFQVSEIGNARVFQVGKSGLFKYFKTGITTDDNFKSFSEGAYSLEWEPDNILTIHTNPRVVSIKYDD
ncbi:hypothetical protein JOC34_000050 [Virgibacillus halotolerans]|uniref:hypothetical protein n=1 Tax=Virgibacillus halotolerans TaxID=1071053 RepID=UPI001960F3CF|nr:hypothetical protein [Virgibacillus halotolerans]MBM7597693.1 hypothetical protein [Virgibacillus halotolerans]